MRIACIFIVFVLFLIIGWTSVNAVLGPRCWRAGDKTECIMYIEIVLHPFQPSSRKFCCRKQFPPYIVNCICTYIHVYTHIRFKFHINIYMCINIFIYRHRFYIYIYLCVYLFMFMYIMAYVVNNY